MEGKDECSLAARGDAKAWEEEEKQRMMVTSELGSFYGNDDKQRRDFFFFLPQDFCSLNYNKAR